LGLEGLGNEACLRLSKHLKDMGFGKKQD